jgi:hypothetical protein
MDDASRVANASSITERGALGFRSASRASERMAIAEAVVPMATQAMIVFRFREWARCIMSPDVRPSMCPSRSRPPKARPPCRRQADQSRSRSNCRSSR